MKTSLRTRMEDLLVMFLTVFSVFLFVFSCFPAGRASENSLTVLLEMNRMVQRAYSILLFVVSIELRKRKRAALIAALILFALNFIRAAVGPSGFSGFLFMGADAVFFGCFLYFRGDFSRPASRSYEKRAVLILSFCLALIFVNAAICFHYMKIAVLPGRHLLWESVLESFGILFGMGSSLPFSGAAETAERVLFWVSWACILGSVLYAAAPWIERQKQSGETLSHARALVNKYGQNNCSYLTLEADKQLYFGKSVDGVIPYGEVGDVIVVNGDPVCADGDFAKLLSEFRGFCEQSAHKLFFLSVTDRFLSVYREQGFGLVKCGEEARFRLADYEISGKKGAKMRMNINHARKAGVTVTEYEPLKARDPSVEEALERISREWLSEKKSELLQFTMGTVGLEAPMDKRYFYASLPDGRIVAFIVFVPFLAKQGYMADVTRHGNDAPGGVMETIIYDAFQKFKSESVLYGSLGVAPLAGLDEKDADPTERLLRFVYDHLNSCYGFRDLYRAKEKYSPTEWLPAYYAYWPKHPSPDMFYAVIKIQNPHAIEDGTRAILHLKERGR